jgi:iron-sulfur cluster repair protein YtfE (RIC family)
MDFSLNEVKSITSADTITARYSPQLASDLERRERFLAELLLCREDLAKAKPSWFDQFSDEVIVEFLRLSHQYFSDHMLPSIEHHLEIWVSHPDCPSRVADYGMFFLREFERGLLRHFKYEEEEIFRFFGPGRLPLEVNWNTFEENHPEPTLDLSKLITLLGNEDEGSEKPMSFRILIEKLRVLDRELQLHEFIEENVLFARLRQVN